MKSNGKMLSFIVIGFTLIATPAFADDFQNALAEVNKVCGTSIIAQIEGSFAGDGGWACQPIFLEVNKACRKDQSFDPHPGGQAWVKENIQTITCKAGAVPAAGASEEEFVTIEHSGQNLIFSTPSDGRNSERGAEIHFRKNLKPLFTARRVWDLNDDLSKAATKTNGVCGGNIELTADIPSYQSAGYVVDYPDLAVNEICGATLEPLEKACQGGDSALINSGVTKVVCRWGGDAYKNTAEPVKPSLDGTTLTVEMGQLMDSKEQARIFDVLKEKLKLKSTN